MFLRSLIATSLVILVPRAALPRPIEPGRFLPKIDQLNASGRNDMAHSDNPTVFRAATAGTTFFGGTFWAADSMRWEAYQDQLWTFDSGVGSSIVPVGGPQGLSSPTSTWVNPFKQSGWHATMEGWIGWDDTYSTINYFRRVGSNDARFGTAKCVGALGGLAGTYSYWCGVFPAEATALCFASGQGYGNAWNVCIEHAFDYPGGNVILGYKYKNDTEDGFDYTYVYCDTSGAGDLVEMINYTGTVSGTASLLLTPGNGLPREHKPIKFMFCVVSDGAWSDQDGLNPTACGAFAVDNIVLSGGIDHTATFETSDDGWALSPLRPGPGGEWSDLRSLNELPVPLVSCTCALEESVLVFSDDHNGHGGDQNNLAASPWVDLKQYGVMGAIGKIIKTNIYSQLPLTDYVFMQFSAQWYPEKCLVTGKLVTSSWTSNGFVFHNNGVTGCTSTLPGTIGSQVDYSGIIPPGAEQVRIAVGVLNFCRFFSNCTGLSNSTPWFDEVGLGVYGDPGVPFIVADGTGRAQDNFPANGNINRTAPGRIDCNDVQGAQHPEPYTTLGDTLVAHCVTSNAEVYVHFKVRPGPGVNMNAFNTWNQSHPASPIDGTFKRARCDTAEYGGSGPISGNWMTSYHESDPNFAAHGATDRTIDAMEVSPTGGTWHLSHDIFPDNLLTPGSRMDYFFSVNVAGSTHASVDPPSAPITPYEVEILPSSFAADNTHNCVLYVDHFEAGAQPLIESALGTILGTGSANVEDTKWDRYDVNAPATGQASLGRPLYGDYGASIVQLLLSYEAIVWDSGDLKAFSLSPEDADVLNPWLTLVGSENCYVCGINNLYLSGNGIVQNALANPGSFPSLRHLMEDIAGVKMNTSCSGGIYRNANCPEAGAPRDETPCVSIVPAPGAPVSGESRTVNHMGQGNGCPELRSFQVLQAVRPDYGGTSHVDELYLTPIKTASAASVATEAGSSGYVFYRIVTDGLSAIYRRDDGTPCDFAAAGTTAITERLREVFDFFGVVNGACIREVVYTGVPGEPSVRTLLLGLAPNPFRAGTPGRIRFSMAEDAPGKLEILDLQGRLIKTVFDAPAKKGPNEVTWDGRDATGASVGSGVYFYRFRALDQDQTRKLVVVGGGN